MTPDKILLDVYKKAVRKSGVSLVKDKNIRENVEYVCRCISNRAGVRLLMACLLGKLHNPNVDPRKPYTEIGGDDCFSGRTYDERDLTRFITHHRLPCNPTTAFLTPTLRNQDQPLTTGVDLIGRPRELYVKTVQLLDDVSKERVSAEAVLIEAIRVLLKMRDENLARMKELMNALKGAKDSLPLSSEAIVSLLEQHLACKKSSRLPVLIIAAAYKAAGESIKERILPLNAHNAADLQTGSLGDVEICLVDDNAVITSYEMKMKRVTIGDIDVAANKIARAEQRIDNYIFITTDVIEPDVKEYATTFYETTGGTEIAILDCLGFIRHFLHFFHRVRGVYLDAYQELVLAEPDSALSQTLKETFLALRKAAESGE
jgi:hypothetical protein